MGRSCLDRETMDHEAARKARLALLKEEINSIHLANTLYWRDDQPRREARAEHYRRQLRLEELREEFAHLTEKP
ncbi:MAG: hypothetical protein WBW85_04955 [Terriglobales bacterium]